MKSYLYHPIFLYYLDQEEAFESPLEPGVFLHASNATEKEPDLSIEGKIPYFINGEWVLEDTPKNLHGNGEAQVSMAGDYIPYAMDINAHRTELLSNGFSEEEVNDILGL